MAPLFSRYGGIDHAVEQAQQRSDKQFPLGAAMSAQMNIRIVHVLLLTIAMGLASCTSTSSLRVIDTPIHQGMTASELQSAFGRPLSIERQPDGSEDWFYNFGTQGRETRPFTEETFNKSEQSYSYGHTDTTTTTMTRLPVHVSPEGRVVGVIPAGSVIVE